MVRIMAGFAAWTAGTVIAVGVTWFGANVVVRNAGVGPGMPVINAAPLPASARPGASVVPPAVSTPAPVGPSPSTTRAATVPVSAAASSSSTQTPAAGVSAYTLTGGRVTLQVTQTSVQLVTAVPDAGYAVQTWSGTGWLRVDFSSGAQVSSLIASWYQHQPAITVTN
jgi:hypothetical protein